ncbi:MAG: Hsp20/alpha crystallin family protein [Anaerolineaceae bacterium]|nr:Hsp20/alpha crystallin family protein [Anaerolineaceae bacterium]
MSTIIRYNPLREAMSLSRQMDRLMEGAMRGSELWDGSMDWALPLDVIENDNEFIVKASLPGIKPEDIEVTYHNQTLTVKGEMKQEEDTSEEKYHLHERRYGMFSRSITLPSDVNGDAIKADFDNGVLALSLPKKEEVKAKRISIQSSGKVIEAKAKNK